MIKDSGERHTFASGANRDMQTGKGRMDLVPWDCVVRLSKHYENGAIKYGERNWEKGIPSSSYLDSAMRHLAKHAMGLEDEDHLAAAVFNIFGLMRNQEEVSLRPQEMYDGSN